MVRQRSAWAIASAIYNVIAGLWNIGFGLFAVLFNGLLLNYLNPEFRDWIGLPPPPAIPPGTLSLLSPALGNLVFGSALFVGIAAILLGTAQIIAAWALLTCRHWARVLAVALHGIVATFELVQIVLLIGNAPGFIVVPLLLLIVNIALMAGLLLPSTARLFAAGCLVCGCGGSHGLKHGCACACHAPAPCGCGCPKPHKPAHGCACACHGAYAHAHHPALSQGHPYVGQATPPTQVTYAGAAGGVAPTEVEAAAPPLLGWLVELSGPRAGRQFRLKQQTTVGRNPSCCDVVLDDGKVSATHARLRFEQGQFVVYDLASTNRTYVNGQPVTQQTLQDGDKIRLGPNTLLGFMRVTA